MPFNSTQNVIGNPLQDTGAVLEQKTLCINKHIPTEQKKKKEKTLQEGSS